jgi:hypothetical protein
VDNAYSRFDNGGAEVWCCDDTYTYEVTITTINSELLAYQNAMADFVTNNYGECIIYDLDLGLTGGGGLKRRSMNGTEELSLSTLERRQGLFGANSVTTIVQLLFLLLSSVEDGNDMLKAEHATCKSTPRQLRCCKRSGLISLISIRDQGIVTTLRFTYPALTTLKNYVDTDITYKYYSYDKLAEQIPCNLEAFNNAVSLGPNNGTTTTDNSCDQWAIVTADPDFFDGDQDYIDSQGPENRRRRSASGLALNDFLDDEEVYHFLEKRDGAPRSYTVSLGIGPNGQPQIIIVVSWVYPSGVNGQAFVDATGVNIRYALGDNTNCVSAVYVETGDPEAVPAWVGKSSRLHTFISRILILILT